MAENWAEVYGEDLAMDYGGFYDELYEMYGDKKPIPLGEVKQAWRSAYGEDLNMEYEGFWETIGGKKHISYVNEDGDILEEFTEGGTFVDQYGDVIEDPNDEEYEMTFGKDSFAPSAFMGNKIESKLVKKPESKPAGMKPESKPAGMPEGAVDIMEKGSLDKAIEKAKPNQEVMKKVMGKEPEKKIEKITEANEPKLKGKK
jgi:hypothetical protein